jgi:hypothetical protein
MNIDIATYVASKEKHPLLVFASAIQVNLQVLEHTRTILNRASTVLDPTG